MYEEIKNEFDKIEAQLMDPSIISDQNKLTSISKKHSDLKDAISMILELEKIENNIKQNEELINDDNNKELEEMAKLELKDLELKKNILKAKIDLELNPADPNDKRNAILEIRAGTGGDESALFAAELFRMYSKYAETFNFKIIILHSSHIGIGGFKEIIFEINGKGAYGEFKYEAGTHRVQRIPETEKQGRVHTSAVTVAVLPEVDEVDIEIAANELRIDTYASSGPGGQCVNTTNSAVRITHLPTGLVAQCQDQKDQHQNKEKAMQILRSRLVAKIENEKKSKEDAERKAMIGDGDRSGKIRTYNFPQDRITDHRIKKNWSQIYKILDGNLGIILDEFKNF